MNKKQIIILFSLGIAIAILVLTLVFTLTQDNENNTDDNSSNENNSVIDNIQDGFNEVVDQTDSQDELNFFNDITIDDKEEILNQESSLASTSTTALNASIQSQYSSEVNEFSSFDGDIESVAHIIPNSEGIFDNYVVNTLKDGSRVLYFRLEEAPEIPELPLIRNLSNPNIYSLAFLQKDDVFVTLGQNVVTVHEFTINGEELWASIIYNRTEFADLYISKPYFKNMNYINNVYLLPIDPSAIYSNGNDLVVPVHIEGGLDSAHANTEFTIDIEGIVNAPVGTDFREFVSSGLNPNE